MAQILINQFMSARISTQSSQRLSSRFNGSCRFASTTNRTRSMPGAQTGFQILCKQNKVARTILSTKQRMYNKAKKSEIATRIKKVKTLAELLLPSATADNVTELETLISEATKAVDKAVSKGVLHKNTGARRKSRMARAKKAVLLANNMMTYA